MNDKANLAIRCAFLFIAFSLQHVVWAQEPSRNVILITLDGLRSEEVFLGADKRLMIPDLGCKDVDALSEKYLGDTPEQSREKLMPFLWDQVNHGGWIAGDPARNSRVQVSNGKYFSYPGYNEILTGRPDPAIDSNAKKYNPNTTVLEWLNQQPALKGKVTAYCSWDVFPYIINDRRSGIPVNAGWMPLQAGRPDTIQAANFLADHLFQEWDGVRYDSFTCLGALEDLATNQPRVLYLSLGETDDWAHAGRYDRYLLAASQNDQLIRKVWDFCQQSDFYRDNTTFILATDHGRGDGREGWKSHSVDLPGSERIWIAAFGAGLQQTGSDQDGLFQQSQIAATVAAFLGLDFTTNHTGTASRLPIAPAADSSQ